MRKKIPIFPTAFGWDMWSFPEASWKFYSKKSPPKKMGEKIPKEIWSHNKPTNLPVEVGSEYPIIYDGFD